MKRILSIAVALSLTLAAACGDRDSGSDLAVDKPGSSTAPVGGLGQESSRARTDDPASATPETSAQSPPRETGSGAATGVATSSGTVEDAGRVGSAGSALLSGSNPSVVIEVDRSGGASLTVNTAGVLGEELREHGRKQQILTGGESQVPTKDVYTAEDLRAITADHRATRSSADRLSVYVLVLSGRFENERATGVAFAATAFAIFPEQLGGGLLGTQRSAFETAVLVHELGHLFGLVNLTGKGEFHEDPDHPGHSRYEGSVMYWAIEDVSLRSIFQGGPPTEFDQYDREEMSRIRG